MLTLQLFVLFEKSTTFWDNLRSCIKSVREFRKFLKVSKGAKIRNRYNQVPHLTQDTKAEIRSSLLMYGDLN